MQKENSSLSLNGHHISITGLGEYHEYQCDVGHGISSIGIMRRLKAGERILQVLRTEHSVMLRVIDPVKGAGELLVADTLETIPYGKEGWWLVLTFNNDTKHFSWSYNSSDEED